MNSKALEPIRILLAEDNEGDIVLMEETFDPEHIKCELKSVRDGEYVLDFLHKREPYTNEPTPDLVLLDINMPAMGGLEALENIRKHSEFKMLPVFMLTSSRLDSEIESAKKLGANGFIVKGADFALQNLIDYAALAKHDASVWVHVGA